VVQGKPKPLSQAVMAWVDASFAPTSSEGGSAATATAAGLHRDIFVVYDHDTPARENLELLIHMMGLNPIVLANLIPEGDTVIEKLENI
jgi:predicted nucleotide-binding protein